MKLALTAHRSKVDDVPSWLTRPVTQLIVLVADGSDMTITKKSCWGVKCAKVDFENKYSTVDTSAKVKWLSYSFTLETLESRRSFTLKSNETFEY
jgi:hypothetical protein